MDSRTRCVAAALLLAGVAAPVSAEVRSRPTRAPAAPRASLAGVPVSFEANIGQVDREVRFLARARGFRAFLHDAGAVFASAGGGAARMEFEGARDGASVRGALPLGARSHYLLGNDPSKWVRDVPHVAEAGVADLYPGVSLRWRPAAGRLLEYDLLLAPGAEPGIVAMRFEGAESVEVDAEGDLLVRTPGGLLRHGRPVAWQDAGGRRIPVAAEFALLGGSRAGFRVGRHDPALPLVIDPVIQYSSFSGGNSFDEIFAVAADPSRSAYLLGVTDSATYPVKTPYQSSPQGGVDMFLTKVAPDGASLVFSTYLGGSKEDFGTALAVDASGSAHVAGHTTSANFPVANALQGAKPSSDHRAGVVAKVAPSGSTLAWSTYLGGTGITLPAAAALDPGGGLVVAGSTEAPNLPITPVLQSGNAGGYDGFIVRFAPAGNTLSWGTYLGGAGTDGVRGVAVDGAGGICVVGSTESSGFPVVNALQNSIAGSRDAFLARIAAGGGSLVLSTFLGGTAVDTGCALALDGQGCIWVTGETASTNFPLVSAVQASPGGLVDSFVAKFAADGGTLLASTYLGGNGDDSALSIASIPGVGTWVGGFTTSTNLAVKDALSTTRKGPEDGFVACYFGSGASLRTLTYLGGGGSDRVYGLGPGGGATVLVGGTSNSTDFPVQGYFQTGKSGQSDGIVLRLQATLLPPRDLVAILAGLTRVALAWAEDNGDETGFVLERSTGGGLFEERATLPPDTVEFQDTGLAPSTDYVWRLRSRRGAELGDPGVPVFLTTPPAPTFVPDAPSDLQAAIVSPRQVDLAWQDNSDNEDFFIVGRSTGSPLFATLATPNLGVTAYTDSTVLPGRTYSYKVLASNPVGSSVGTDTATLTMPSTLSVSVVQGRITDTPKLAGDSVIVKGTLAFGGEAESAAFDSALQSVSLRLGDHGKPPLMDVPAGDPGWTVRRGVHTWKSPKGSLVKAKLVVRPETGEFSVKLTHLTLAPAPASPVRVTVGVGTDSGFGEDAWLPGKKAGQLRFP